MKNIFVGNLDFNTSEEDVRQLFAAYGWVDRVTIVRDRDTDQPCSGVRYIHPRRCNNCSAGICEM